jgi:hypothetical protein
MQWGLFSLQVLDSAIAPAIPKVAKNDLLSYTAQNNTNLPINIKNITKSPSKRIK